MKVLHIITSLVQGGAEAVLCRLISATSPTIKHVVVCLTEEAYFGPRLRAAGTQVVALGMPRGRLTLSGLLKMRHTIVDAAPDLVQTWMYHADLIGGLLARGVGVRAIVWGIRNSNLDADKSSFSARAVARVCARLSRWLPTTIVCCSTQAVAVHQAIGYQAEKFRVVANGYDLSRFTPDANVRSRVRAEWGIDDHEILLGMVARWDPQKDHENLLQALAHLKTIRLSVRCVLVGTGLNTQNTSLTGLINRQNLQDRVILAGPNDDIPSVMNALDLHVLSSAYGEAFPNVLAEAMACGVPCVTTNVGDAAHIVGDTGWVVPPHETLALANGIEAALRAHEGKAAWQLRQIAARQRIVDNYSLAAMGEAFRAVWQETSSLAVKG